MRSRRAALAVVILVTLTLLTMLAGCGPRIGAVESVAPDELVISLPSLVIDVQPDGEMLIQGRTLAEIGALLGQDLAVGPLDPGLVKFLVHGDIQHIQLDNTPDGPRFLINGEPIPSIRWDTESLSSLAVALEMVGVQAPALKKLLPLVQDFGLGLTVRFPLSPDAEPIPLHVTGPDSSASKARAAREAWLAAIGNRTPNLQLALHFDSNGVASFAGASQGLLSSLGLPLDGLSQPPEVIKSFRSLGIEQLTLSSGGDGVRVIINDDELPAMTWADGEMTHLLKIALQTGLQDSLISMDPNIARILDLIERWLPAVQTTEMQLTVTFGE